MTIQSIGQRLQLLIDHMDLNKNSFSRLVGQSSNVSIIRIINDPARGISSSILQKIVKAIPQLNLNWLLAGTGDMFNPESKLWIDQIGQSVTFNDVMGDVLVPKLHPGDTTICQEVNVGETIVLGELYRIMFGNELVYRYIVGEDSQNIYAVTHRSMEGDYRLKISKSGIT